VRSWHSRRSACKGAQRAGAHQVADVRIGHVDLRTPRRAPSSTRRGKPRGTGSRHSSGHVRPCKDTRAAPPCTAQPLGLDGVGQGQVTWALMLASRSEMMLSLPYLYPKPNPILLSWQGQGTWALMLASRSEMMRLTSRSTPGTFLCTLSTRWLASSSGWSICGGSGGLPMQAASHAST
jgi:hypothetical protein